MKKILVSMVMLITLTAFSACGTDKLADSFDEAAVKETVHGIITSFGSQDFEGVAAQVDSTLQDVITAQVLKDGAEKVMASPGELIEIKGDTIKGKKDEAGGDMAVMQSIVRYENQTVIYTITLNIDMKIIGFYLK